MDTPELFIFLENRSGLTWTIGSECQASTNGIIGPYLPAKGPNSKIVLFNMKVENKIRIPNEHQPPLIELDNIFKY